MKKLPTIARRCRFPRLPNGRAVMLAILITFYSGYSLQELRLHRNAYRHPQPEFHGPPRFVPVDGNAVQYATNTSATILRIGQEYFLYREGAWFRSSSAQGQYTATAVPPVPVSTMLLEEK